MLRFARERPATLAIGVCSLKGAACDVLVQKLADRTTHLDWTRVAVFTLFGGVFSGAWQYMLFSRIMPAIVPGAAAFVAKPLRDKLRDPAGMRGVGVQLAIENGINNALLYFPCFYVIQEALRGGRVSQGLARYRENWRADVADILRVFAPFQLVNFSLTPVHLRPTATAAVSFCWTCYVSFSRGGGGGERVAAIAHREDAGRASAALESGTE